MRSYLTTLGSLAAVGVMLSAFSCGSDSPKTTQVPSAGPADPDLAAARAALASTPLGRVVSRDARGAGRMVIASPVADAPRLNLGHETVSRLHFERHAAALGLSADAVSGAVFKAWHTMPTGAGVAQFEHRINDIEVFRARASVVVDANNQLVSIASSFPGGNMKAWNKQTTFSRSAEEAMAAAYSVHAGVPMSSGGVRDLGAVGGTAMRNYAVDAPRGAAQVTSATAKPVLFPTGDRLEPAYYIEILGRAAGSRDNDARGYVIAASDGRVLQQESLTMNDVFNYRVWASATHPTHIPDDGPIADVTPHPTGLPDMVPQTLNKMPIMVAMDGFNKNPNGVADPWLPTDATYTWGNNVQAYSDRNQFTTEAGATINNGFQDAGPDGGGGDYRADLTGTKTFDRIYNLDAAPEVTPEQIKAAVTQIFYTTNWLHDYWYDSGFDEKSNNAQLSNYGRGGVEGDPLQAQGQDSADSGQSNNANMSAMADGTPPVMQMYVWTGLPNRKLEVPGVTFHDPIGAAGFGPQTFDFTGPAVLSNDGDTSLPPGTTGTGTVTDACQVPTNVMGKIAVIDRGVCAFTAKVGNAMMGGATGIILVNNAPGNTPVSPGGAFTTTLPLLGTSLEDGVNLKTVLSGMPMAHMQRGVETMRDGTIDNTVVAHEWGHYWHHRLVQCGSSSCGGMSEGWADFDALMMVIRDGDTFDGGKTYALAQYAAAGISKDGSYFGIRRAPYARDMAKNPFTFGHIRQMAMLPTTAPLAPAGTDMSEVHNVGEIWAEMLFEGYANLIDLLKGANPPMAFEDIKRRMADYLTNGMKATPNEPTFVDQRDAILSAVLATKRMDDFTAIAKGFAKRGLGVAAVAPPTSSTMLNEAVEDFSFAGALALGDAKIDDSVMSCDHDGVLDANESGKLTVTVKNSGWVKLTKTQIKASSTDANITFATPGTDMASIDPYGTATITLGISAKASLTKKTTIPITITMTDADAVKPSVDVTVQATVNYDDNKASSKTDDVESESTVWTPTEGMVKLPVVSWARAGDAMNHLWHGDEAATPADESLESPDLIVGSTEAFTMTFKHQYSFEVGAVPGSTAMGYFDGGVIEVSEDMGKTWNDVSTYVDPMYPQTIFTGAALNIPDTNVLAGKKGFGGASANYPKLNEQKIDFGMKLAGKTVRVRFRIGTDDGNGTTALGWDVDDLAFTGITNSPFGKVVDNSGICTGDGGTTDGGTKTDAGTGGAGGTGGTGGTTTDSSCNCSVPGGSSGSGTAAVGVFGALAMLLRGRRRRQQG